MGQIDPGAAPRRLGDVWSRLAKIERDLAYLSSSRGLVSRAARVVELGGEIVRAEEDAKAYAGGILEAEALRLEEEIEAAQTAAEVTAAAALADAVLAIDSDIATLGGVVGDLASEVNDILPITGTKIEDNSITTPKLAALAITAKHTITGALFQTTDTAARGIKITSSGLAAYDASGNPTLVADASTGAITMLGDLLSGSNIQGATITGVLQTNPAAARGIKITDTGLIAYDNSGDPTLTINGTTGAITMLGDLTSGSTITGADITGATVTGGVLRTAASGKRWVVNEGGGNDIRAYTGGVSETAPGLQTTEYVVNGTTHLGLVQHWAPSLHPSGNRYGSITLGDYRIGSTSGSLFEVLAGSSVDRNAQLIVEAEVARNRVLLFARQGLVSSTLEVGPTGIQVYGPTYLNGTVVGPLNGSLSVFAANNELRSNRAAAVTTTAPANVYINPGAGAYNFARSTSLRAHKIAPETIDSTEINGLLDLDVQTWIDRTAAEAYAETLDMPDGDERDQALADMTTDLRRIPGLIAEDVEEVADRFVTRDSDGNLTGVAYDRIGVAWIPIVRDLITRIEALEGATP